MAPGDGNLAQEDNSIIIRIPEHLERFVHDKVRTGRYSTEDEVISDALEQVRKHAQPIATSQGSHGSAARPVAGNVCADQSYATLGVARD
jgi:hypothetical protein